jgi:hypothetical protein
MNGTVCHNLLLPPQVSTNSRINWTSSGKLIWALKKLGAYSAHQQQVQVQVSTVSDTTRSWRSAEDGINTLLECYQTVEPALFKLPENSTDASTVNMQHVCMNEYTILKQLYASL